MSVKSRDIFVELIGVLTLIAIIASVCVIRPEVLTRFTDGLFPLNRIVDAETLYLWRERLFDTVFQALAILVGLMGVLVLVIWGEKKHD